MNNLHNYRAEKFVSPPKIGADNSETYGNDQRRGKPEKSDKTKPSEALKIFYESENFRANEPRYEWNYKSFKKKNCRDIPEKIFTEEKIRARKNWKKIQKREIPNKTNFKKSSYLDIIESQLIKAKASGNTNLYLNPEIQSSNNLENECGLDEYCDHKDKDDDKIDFEKTPVHNFSNQSKLSIDPDGKPKEIEIKSKGSLHSTRHSIMQKYSQKAVNKSSDMKTITSDFRKKHINEILKNHAQKVHANSVKALYVQEHPVVEMTDIQKVIQNISSTKSIVRLKEEREKPQKIEVKNENVEELTLENSKIKVTETAVKDTKKAKENVKSEDKKKLPVTWVKGPQSNELERRLKGNWEQSKLTLLYQNKETKLEANMEEEKHKSKKIENSQQEEKKNEKRPTYTDRLLLLKIVTKNLEEKKQAIEAKEQAIAAEEQAMESAKTSEVKKKAMETKKQAMEAKRQAAEAKKQEAIEAKKKSNKEIREIAPSKIEYLMTPSPRVQKPRSAPVMEENITQKIKGPVEEKDEKSPDNEHVIKTPKATRSTELRDLVTQAIKDHKIFCVFDNHTYIVRPVREELLNRGWLEVIPDRRLIPRRKPPPMGPVIEREKTIDDRNSNALEAILTAKENFAKEIQETVFRSPSFKLTTEKPKPPNTLRICPNKKCSQESLEEVLSQFRIAPPTAEKKKNNIKIREFTSKYQALLQKEKEREEEIKKLREKEKNAKNQKKEKGKISSLSVDQRTKPNTPEVLSPLSTVKSVQEIIESLQDNKAVIINLAKEIKNIDTKAGGNINLGALLDSTIKNMPAIKESQPQENEGTEKTSENSPRCSYTESEARAISKLIQSTNARIHFMWLSIKPAIHLKCFNYSPEIINKFQKTTFCTKIGLWSHLNNIQWYAHEVHNPAKSPRMYNTGEADDLQAFFQDFQLTACIGILKWLSDTFFEKGLKAVQTKKGKVPLKAFEFAIKQCEKYIRFKENEDLGVYDEPKIHQEDWNTFLQWFYTITNDHGKIQESSSAQLMVVYTKAVEILKSIRRYWPEIDIDGRLNIWIMKPYCASCGRGIFMTNNVFYIGQHSKYIVQKYIEKPLLIYNTKFDIRQWFMITKLTPLEIWMYKECYLRFCTQPFALRNLHESVHLSNNSVQRKYTSYHDPTLPDQNMWDSNTFQLYLRTIGHPTTWEDVIYPGMRDAIVSTMLAAQDTFDGPRKSWFEVYGADFMLSSNLKEGPWLIEINENPAMDPSTKVTAKLCPQMLRDVIKVVVDKRANKGANTGQWELVYRQNYSPSYGSVDIDVRGKKIAKIPHTAKVSLNLDIDACISPMCDKRYISEEVGPGRPYKHVKCYGSRFNNERLGYDFEKAQNKKKLRKNLKMNETDSNIKNSDQRTNVHMQVNMQNSTNAEIKFIDKNRKKTSNANRIFGRAVSETRNFIDIFKEANILEGNSLDRNDSFLKISSANGMKNSENCAQLKKIQKQSMRTPNLIDNVMTFYSRFITEENERTIDTQNHSDLQIEKSKFMKYYKI